MMYADALIGLVFAGLCLAGLGNEKRVPVDATRDFLVSDVQAIGHQAPAVPRVNVPIFKDSEFPFVTINADDGGDKGGGWQEARANLEFIRIDVIPPGVTKWKCQLTIGMPLRTAKMGKIPASLAATMSSGITNMVTTSIDFELPQGIFCDRFIDGVKMTFKATYPWLGSSVRHW